MTINSQIDSQIASKSDSGNVSHINSQAPSTTDTQSTDRAQLVADEKGLVSYTSSGMQTLNQALDLFQASSKLFWYDVTAMETWSEFVNEIARAPNKPAYSLLYAQSRKNCKGAASFIISYTPETRQIIFTVDDVYGLDLPREAADVLRQVYHFTLAEAQCALLAIVGNSMTEIAQKRHTSLETVKSQCKAIREKMGIGSMNEAVLRMRSIKQLYFCQNNTWLMAS